MLALLGGIGGVLLAHGRETDPRFQSAKSRLEYVSIDVRCCICPRSVGFTAIVFGLIPATQFPARSSINSKEGGRGGVTGSPRHWMRNSLVVAEVAVALVLLTGAGLLVRSFLAVTSVDPGFDRDRVLALQVFLPRNYQKPELVTGFFNQSLEKIAAVSGVQSAAVVSSPPFIDLEQDVAFTIQGLPVPPKGREPSAFYTEVSPDYLRVMSVPLQRGRFFTKFDKADSPQVVVINETMARRHFAVKILLAESLGVFDQPEVREIVGVIATSCTAA